MAGNIAQTEPVRLAALVRSLILIAGTLGALGLSEKEATVLGVQVEAALLALLPLLIATVEWISAYWVRSKVASPHTAEVLANAVKGVEQARGKGMQVKVPLAAVRAAERVLGEPEHPVRWMHDGTP